MVGGGLVVGGCYYSLTIKSPLCGQSPLEVAEDGANPLVAKPDEDKIITKDRQSLLATWGRLYHFLKPDLFWLLISIPVSCECYEFRKC